MAYIVEDSTWSPGIYQLEEDDLVQGGADGIDNVQAKQLAARTRYLKEAVESLGTGKQDADATLAAIALLTGVADRMLYFTGNDVAALTPITALARTLLAAVDQAGARSAIGAVSQAQVDAAIAALVDSSPTQLNTLNELAAALGDDANFAATVTAALAAKAALAVPQAFTKGQRGAEAALPASTGTVTLDLEASNNWGGTLTGNMVLANPSTMPVGQSGVIRITQHASSIYTIGYGSYFKPADGTTLPALSDVAGGVNDLVYYVESATRILVARVGGAA